MKYIKGKDVSLPDHVDLVWNLRHWIHQTGNADQIFKRCATQFQRGEDYIRRLYDEIEPTLAPDPDIKK